MDREEALQWAYLFLACANGKKILISEWDEEKEDYIFREEKEKDEWIMKAFEEIGDPKDFKVVE